MTALILGFPGYEPQSRRLAAALGLPCEIARLHRFPDDESLVQLPPRLPEHVILCRSLDHPNDKLVELLLAARAARELGAARLTLVAPYLCYMRQDAALQPGQAVSQRIVGDLIADLVDGLVTVDPHLHRIARLDQAVPLARTATLHAAPLMGALIEREVERPLVMGPDSESEQWVRAIALPHRLDYAVASKERRDDTHVSIRLPDIDVRGRNVVLADDVASTGHTLAVIAEQLHARGAARTHAVVTHALFAGDAYARLKHAGIDNIWSTDSIAHRSNAIALDMLLAAALRPWLQP
jgi:ribose-phosphate pyrophosphokinase